MKKLLLVFMILGLTVFASTGVMGAVHESTGDFAGWYLPNTIGYGFLSLNSVKLNNWFKVKEDTPYFKAAVTLNTQNYDFTYGPFGYSSMGNEYGVEYYQNDQSFVEGALQYTPKGNDSLPYFKGSFLTKSGFFLGFSYLSIMDETSLAFISPGYRFNLNDKGYIALSADYYQFDEGTHIMVSDDNGIFGYDLDIKYLTEKSKLYGQVYIGKEVDENFYDLAYNYQVSEELVVGGFFKNFADEINVFGIGCTWNPAFMVLDARVSVTDSDYADSWTVSELSGMFKVDDQILVGVEISKCSELSDSEVIYKAAYASDYGTFSFAYRASNGTYYDSLFYLEFKKDLK